MSRSAAKRLATIDTLISGCRAAPTGGIAAGLGAERKQLDKTHSTSSPRRELLEVLHMSRLLDSFLASFLAHHLVTYPGPPALGSYLVGLRDHNRPALAKLPERRRAHHQGHVVKVRNRVMHNAGAFPSKKQADELLSSMHTCIAEVVALE